MDFIRNKEVKRQIVVNGLLALFWCGICFIVDSKSLWIVLVGYCISQYGLPFFHLSKIQKNC